MIRRNRVSVMNRRRFESKRKRFEARDSSGVFYKAWNASFEACEDDYKNGELDYVNGWNENCACSADTLPELIKKVQDKLYMTDELPIGLKIDGFHASSKQTCCRRLHSMVQL